MRCQVVISHKKGTNIYLESGVLEVHDGVRNGDVQLENDLLHVERAGQAIRQTEKTLWKNILKN